MKNKKLHLGCGSYYLEGYWNIDFPLSEHSVGNPVADQHVDFLKLDYPTGSLEEVRCHHVFEHFNRARAIGLLLQWRRWLRIGGRVHIETPDFDRAIRYYQWSGPKGRAKIGRHIFGSQEAGWAIHYDYWSKRKFKKVFKKLGFRVLKIRQRSNSLATKFNNPIFNLLGLFVPLSIYKKFGLNKLPNIEVIAEKTTEEVDELVVAREILSEYLVGDEGDALLDVWVGQVYEQSINNNTDL